jgi:hypothetical protein
MEEDELEAARVRAAAERRDHGRKRISLHTHNGGG